MHELLRRRRGALTVLAAGVVVATMIGAVLAVISDSTTVTGNQVRTKPYDTPAPTLEMVVNPEAATCDDPSLTYGDADVAQTWAQNDNQAFDWAQPGLQSWSFTICLRNAGNAAGSLSVTIANIASYEVGACATSEEGAGDTTCADGDDGELSALLATKVSGYSTTVTPTMGGSSASCTGDSANMSLADLAAAPSTVDATLAPGETCMVWLHVILDGDSPQPEGLTGVPEPTEEQKLLSQTDKTTFDIISTITGL